MEKMPLLTVQQHILEEQRRHHPEATGEFSWLLSGITLASKIIADNVRRAGLADILGGAGRQNVQGEQQQKRDVLANQALLYCLGARGNVAIMQSAPAHAAFGRRQRGNGFIDGDDEMNGSPAPEGFFEAIRVDDPSFSRLPRGAMPPPT